MALPAGLLEAVRNYLDITWVDATGDTKLTGIIERGMKYIDSLSGATMDYSEESKPRELLFDYCRYARSNALSDFQPNYLHELLSLQISQEVKAYKTLTSLLTLTVGALVILPVFDPAITFYTASTPNAEDIITATLTDPAATISIVNGTTAVINGTAATWVIGENVVIITVTNGSTVTIYTLKINKVA